LLGKIVVNNESVFAIVTEEFSDGAAGVGGQELKGGGVGSRGGDDDGVFHGVEGLEDLDNVGDGRTLLSDGDVDAVELFLDIAGFEVGFLVDDCVNSNGGFACLSISDDQFSLSSADGDQAVH
jgi:hypothetical protein